MQHEASPDPAPMRILVAPHPALRARARDVEPGDESVPGLVASMMASMREARGIGLAAPQVGVGLRVAVIHMAERGEPVAMLNPAIDWSSDEHAVREEGCLSLPGPTAQVSRPVRVKASYTDMSGARVRLEADGLLAACLQHEIDHLDGVLITDRISPLKRNMFMRKVVKAAWR